MCQRQVLWLFGTSSPTFWMSCRISTDTPDRKVARLTQARSAGACAGIAAIAAQLGYESEAAFNRLQAPRGRSAGRLAGESTVPERNAGRAPKIFPLTLRTLVRIYPSGV
jgi:hypothetical protein